VVRLTPRTLDGSRSIRRVNLPISFVAALVVTFVLRAASGAADDIDRPTEWLARWAERRQSCKAVEYDLAGSVTIPARFYKDSIHPGEAFPAAAFTYRRRLTITLDFANGRARRYEKGMTWQLNQRRFIPSCQIDLFDGHRFQTLRPRAENSSANWQPPPHDAELIERGEKHGGRFFETIDLPIVFAHGLVANADEALTPDRLLTRPDRSGRSLQSQFANVRREAPSLLVLESKPPAAAPKNHEEIGLDLERGGAPIGWSVFAEGKRTASIAVKNKQTLRGWFPDGWTMLSEPDSPGPQRRVDETQSVTITFDLPLEDSTFHAKATPGMIVYRLSENRRYVAGGETAPDLPLDQYLARQPDHSKAAK
jgi:hypothetical protein